MICLIFKSLGAENRRGLDDAGIYVDDFKRDVFLYSYHFVKGNWNQ
jgi:hypothetical protein